MEEQVVQEGPEITESAARAEGRRGETRRQQIRQAKAVSRRQFPAEQKIRIVMEGIQGDISVSELCRQEGIHATVYYKWLKDSAEAGKRRLRGGNQREADRSEVHSLREENARLK